METSFINLANIIEALPRHVRDDEALRDHLPGLWPTVGDLRSLVKQLQEEGWQRKP